MSNPGADHWQRLREGIPVTDRMIYMNSGWSGPLPTPVVEAVEQRLRREWHDGPTTRAVFQETMDLRRDLRKQLAAMIHADEEEILLTQNTTEGLNLVLSGLPWQSGDAVVTTTVEHVGGLIPAYYLRQRHGVELRFVTPDVADSPEQTAARFAAVIDSKVRVVLLSHIAYATGQRFPLAEIQRIAHEAGARVVVDGAQTLGHVPLDLHADGADYYALPAHKWLLGPEGVGALFVRRELISTLEPTYVSGRGAASFEFDGSGFVPERESIGKFLVSTTSPALAAGMAAALTCYQEAGPDAVWERILDLARLTSEALAAIDGVSLLSPTRTDSRCGLVTFQLKGVGGSDLAEELQRDHGIICRGVREVDACRLSLHYFNTEAEIDTAVGAVRQAAKNVA